MKVKTPGARISIRETAAQSALTAEPLVDRIYEAAFLPEYWPGIMQDLSDQSGCAAGAIGLFDDNTSMKYQASAVLAPVLADIQQKDEWKTADIIQMMFALRPPTSFFYDHDHFPAEIVAQNNVWNSRARPLGIGGQVGCYIHMPTGELVLFGMARWLHHDRPTDRELAFLDSMLPHLSRAGLVAARLRLERAHATTSALRSLGMPAAVLASNGRVLATNELLEDLPHVFRPAAFGKLSLGSPEADALLMAALSAEQTGSVQPVRSIPIRVKDSAPYVVHILPVRRSVHDIFSKGDMVLAATRIDASTGRYPPSTLIGLFDFAPAEAKLAVQLAEGRTIAEAALASGITVKTARTYVDRLFAKTGTRRQVDLVALIRSTAVVAAED